MELLSLWGTRVQAKSLLVNHFERGVYFNHGSSLTKSGITGHFSKFSKED